MGVFTRPIIVPLLVDEVEAGIVALEEPALPNGEEWSAIVGSQMVCFCSSSTAQTKALMARPTFSSD